MTPPLKMGIVARHDIFNVTVVAIVAPFVTQQLSVFTVSAFRRWSNDEEAERKRRGTPRTSWNTRDATARITRAPRPFQVHASARASIRRGPRVHAFTSFFLRVSSTTATVATRHQKKRSPVLSRVPLLLARRQRFINPRERSSANFQGKRWTHGWKGHCSSRT